MSYRFDSFCGLYCGACLTLRANKENRLDAAAEAWGMKPEDLICNGCKSEVNASSCRECEIKACAKSKGVEFCYECNEYPCQYIKDLQADEWVHHIVIMDNLEKIKSTGLDNWLAEQEKRWSCPECGFPTGWYDETCKKCGAVVVSCENER